jgi:UrcA family protein
MTVSRLLLACALAAATLSSALADDLRFSYRAHELETPEKLGALLERIERTAQQACRTEPALPPHYGNARAACAANLVSAIVSRIDDSRLYLAARQKPGMETLDPDADRFAATK